MPRTWDDDQQCDECCNGDRCDDRSHYSRPKCPHCKGTGCALWTVKGRDLYAARRLAHGASNGQVLDELAAFGYPYPSTSGVPAAPALKACRFPFCSAANPAAIDKPCLDCDRRAASEGSAEPESSEPFWYAVISEDAPIINKAIRSDEVAEEYAQKCRENGYEDVKVVPLYRSPMGAASEGSGTPKDGGGCRDEAEPWNEYVLEPEALKALPPVETEVLLWTVEDYWDDDVHITHHALHMGEVREDGATRYLFDYMDTAHSVVTHWMPLPAGPHGVPGTGGNDGR